MPVYKCKGKDCSFATDDIADFVVHTVKENMPKAETTVEEPVKKRHETAEDYLSCPECFPKFEKAFLARGYEKKKEPEKKPEGLGL